MYDPSVLFAIMTIAMQVGVAVLVILYYSKKNPFASLISKNILLFGTLISFASVAGSLYYSEILGLEPCLLCWYQRIFWYALFFVLLYAFFKKDRNIIPYGIILSMLGFVVAVYQYVAQVLKAGNISITSCGGVAETAVDCTERYVSVFNYVTIPLMSVTMFALLIIMFLIAQQEDAKTTD